MNDEYKKASTAYDAFYSIMTEHKQHFDDKTLASLEKKMCEQDGFRETDVKMTIMVPNKTGGLMKFKYQIGDGKTQRMINMRDFQINKYPNIEEIDDAPRIFNIIKSEYAGQLDEKIKDDLDEHINGIIPKLEGRKDVRFLIYVPLTKGPDKEVRYRIGSGDFPMVIQLGRKKTIDHFKDFGKHVLSNKLYLFLVLPLALFVAGYNTTDMIKVIHVFDPLVSNKIYEVFILLLNKTDEAHN